MEIVEPHQGQFYAIQTEHDGVLDGENMHYFIANNNTSQYYLYFHN